MGESFLDYLQNAEERQLAMERLEKNRGLKFDPSEKTYQQKADELKRVHYLVDSTSKNRYAKTTTLSNPLGGLWS